MTTFGFELEVSSGASSVLAQLRRDRLTEHRNLHEYHCGCEDCAPTTSGPLFKAQEDCTANGEFITRILTYGSRDADRAIAGISRALLLSGASTDGRVGNHVHVGSEDLDSASQARLTRLFCRYQDDLVEIAAANRDMRAYNYRQAATAALWDGTVFAERSEDAWGFTRSDFHFMSSGSYLAEKCEGKTMEFRLWNATKAAWRIRTHVGISVGMVEAAIAGVDCTQRDPRCFEEVLGAHFDAPTWAGILHQRHSKGGLSLAA